MSMDRKDLRRLICQKLFTDQLPAIGVTTYGATAASGEMCDACAGPVASGELAIHGIARSNQRDQPIRFHLACFDIWSRERRLLSIAAPPRQRWVNAMPVVTMPMSVTTIDRSG
jgi:hypothetical protein